MRDFLILFVHLIGIVVRLAKPGGLRSVVAESVLVRHQLLILNRGRKRAPKLRIGSSPVCVPPFIRPARLVGSAIVLKLSTLLYFHNLLRRRRYGMLFSPKRGRRSGRKGLEKDLIGAVVEMKRRNPSVENHCSGGLAGCLVGIPILAPICLRFRWPGGPRGCVGLC